MSDKYTYLIKNLMKEIEVAIFILFYSILIIKKIYYQSIILKMLRL